jgi:hypothetical protein
VVGQGAAQNTLKQQIRGIEVLTFSDWAVAERRKAVIYLCRR